MSLNFQNKIVFPAPETSYTTESAAGQVLYIPRNILAQSNSHFESKKHQVKQQSAKQAQAVKPVKLPKDEVQEKAEDENEIPLEEQKPYNIVGMEGRGNQPQNLEPKLKSKMENDDSSVSSETGSPKNSFSTQFKKSIKINDPALEHIPVLYLPCEEGGTKVVIYFHGNAEDIGLAFDLLYMFGEHMKMHMLAVEYPGYGLYKQSKPDEQKIKEDAESIYDYLTNVCGVKDSDIILFGRSMGSGPTSYLASKKQCHSLLLMSPYMSIKDAAKDLFGWAGSMVSLLVYERFRNIDNIKNSKCPCFFLHGMVDTLIPYNHSVELNNVCPNISQLHLVPDMDHNEFKFLEDLIQPFQKFILSLDGPKTLQVDRKIKIINKQGIQGGIKEESKEAAYPEDRNRFKFEIIEYNKIKKHFNDFDQTYVQYNQDGTLDIVFDSQLFEPPAQVLKLEFQLKQQSEAQKQKQ